MRALTALRAEISATLDGYRVARVARDPDGCILRFVELRRFTGPGALDRAHAAANGARS